MTTRKPTKPTVPTTTATYEPLPAIVDAYGLDVATATDDQITAAASGVQSAVTSLGRRTAEHVVNARNVVGALIHAYYLRHGGKDGSPVAADAVTPATWGKVKPVFSPQVLGSFGLGESAAAQAWRTWRADGLGRFARWADLTADEDVSSSDPASFNRESADSFLRWAMADADNPKRTDDDGRIIIPGSNRSDVTGETVRSVTAAAKRDEDKAAKDAIVKAAKARAETDPVRQYLVSLSDEDLAAAIVLAPIVQRARVAAAKAAAKAAAPSLPTPPVADEVVTMSAEDMLAEITRLRSLVPTT